MKKIILIILCFLLTGCYNYKELDQLAIVSLLSVDYKNDEYNITIEIRENIKNEENASLIYKASGYSLDSAIQNLALSLNKTLYLIDLDVLLLSTNAINYKLDSIIDYLIRENNISINFNLLINDNVDEVIEIIKDKKKIVGKYIDNIFESENNNVIEVKMADFVETYLNEFKDLVLPIGTVENDEFVINSGAIFNGEKIIDTLDFNDVQAYNLLKNYSTLTLYKVSYEDRDLVFKVLSGKSKFEYVNGEIVINIKINGIFDEMEKVDINNKEIMKKLKNLLTDKINKSIISLNDKLRENNSDIFSYKKIIYNKTRVKSNDISDLKIKNKISIEVDRKGFIFDSIGEKYAKDN